MKAKKVQKAGKKLTKTQRSQVKRIVNSNLERKFVQVMSASIYNAQANVAANEMAALMPPISVGDNSTSAPWAKDCA